MEDNKIMLINKFKELWEDAIEESQEEINQAEEELSFNSLNNFYEGKRSTWQETWEDFLKQNEFYNSLSKDEQEEIIDINIFEKIFN